MEGSDDDSRRLLAEPVLRTRLAQRGALEAATRKDLERTAPDESRGISPATRAPLSSRRAGRTRPPERTETLEACGGNQTQVAAVRDQGLR